MKHNNFTSSLVAVLLSTLIAASGISCVIFGFDLDVPSFSSILLCLFLFAALWALCMHSRRAFWIFLPTALVVVGFLLLTGGMRSVEQLLFTITRRYHGAYGWGYIWWSGDADQASPTMALILLGCLVIMPIQWVMLRRKWVGFGLLAGLIPLVVCCIVTDTEPNAASLLPLVCGLLLLAMTQLTRRRSAKDANRLIALLLVPVVVFSSLLLSASQEDSHRYQASALQTWAEELLHRIQGNSSAGLLGTGGTPAATVDLSQIGPLEQSDRVILYVTAPYNGIFYLRGQSYDTYTGTRWISNRDTTSEGGWPTISGTATGEVKLNVLENLSLRYTPYYVQNEFWTANLADGHYDNPNRRKTYTFDWIMPDASSSVSFTPLSDYEVEIYTELPSDTLRSASEILDGLSITGSTGVSQAASIIASYVQGSASYSLDTQAMPEDTADFALWFLEESDTGYCVHFASAATVLLRAAGIPARYISGYISYTVPGMRATVTGKQAHAWVEYLDPQQGWTVLDATPGASELVEPPTTEPEESTTLPTQTEETTLPTQTEETTLPTAPSAVTTKPTATAPTQAPVKTTPVWQETWFQWLLLAALIWLLIAGQYHLRLRHREKWLRKGSENRQALHRWKYVCRMARRTRQQPPEELRQLAEKAAFSQHTLTKEELEVFDRWLDAARKTLLDKPLPLRFLLKLLFAIR